MTKHIYFLFVAVFLFLSFDGSSQTQHLAGVRLGSYEQIVSTGFTYRYSFANNNAIERILNLHKNLSIGALYESFKPIASINNLQWFYGGGAFVGFGSKNKFGITGIAGADYHFDNIPINLSLDWKPEITFIKELQFRASTIAFSVRFLFPRKN